MIKALPQFCCATGLCLCVPAAAEWLTEQVVSIIDTQGVDYIVTDGEDMLKRCPGVCEDDNYAAAEYGCVDCEFECLQ